MYRDYQPTHTVQLRVKPMVWQWVLAKSMEAGMPPSTFINHQIEEAAWRERREVRGDDGSA